MTVLSDFEVIGTASTASNGKWKSRNFSAGGRSIATSGTPSKEIDNAYVSLALTSPDGGQDVTIRIIVNDHPLSVMVFVPKASQREWISTFPASFLKDGSGNIIGLHSVGEKPFIVINAICHFRQDS
jgi:hypothetical protein